MGFGIEIEFLGVLGFNTAVSSFLDTAVFELFWAGSRERPRYLIFSILQSMGVSACGLERDRGIAYVGYRGLVPFLGICDVKCSVLGWGSEGLSGWFPKDCLGVCDKTFSVV